MNKVIKMVKKKIIERKVESVQKDCKDKLCPRHGIKKLKLRGRTFEGLVTKKFHDRIAIQFERIIKISKYERYEKRKTKLQARLPDCMGDSILVGDLVKISETRPISKMIHFVVTEIIKHQGGNS